MFCTAGYVFLNFPVGKLNTEQLTRNTCLTNPRETQGEPQTFKIRAKESQSSYPTVNNLIALKLGTRDEITDGNQRGETRLLSFIFEKCGDAQRYVNKHRLRGLLPSIPQRSFVKNPDCAP